MRQYKELVKEVLLNGKRKSNRTGVDTLSIFGWQSVYDLNEGFPLLTTKKVNFNLVYHELMWFLRGETNISTLKAPQLWKPWADKSGECGPIYGKQWVDWDMYCINPVINIPIDDQDISPFVPTALGVGAMGNYKTRVSDPVATMLKELWNGILKRCYSPKHIAYPIYGGRGVFMDKRWLIFENFQKDVKKLPNWELKLEFPKEYSLDKDFYCSNVYSPETCIWANKKEQSVNCGNTYPFKALSPNGVEIVFSSINKAAKDLGLTDTCISNCLNNKQKTHKGWTFTRIEEPVGYKVRYRNFNQIRALIASLKHNPDSRRHCVSAWNTSELERMSLTPCHSFFQCNVADGVLDLQMYQRSADIAIGVPFNIASYALLLTMLAKECNLKPGRFIHTIGDAHIYVNHIEGLKVQLDREEKLLPVLAIKNQPFEDFYTRDTTDDYVLSGYDPHPFIRFEVAV